MTTHAEAVAELERLNAAGQLNSFTSSLYDWVANGRTLTDRQIAALMRPRREERQVRRNAPSITEDGMYRTSDGTIYKVQVAVHGSGRLYAKKLRVHEGEFSMQNGYTGTRVTFEYAPGAIFDLTPEDKMTLEQAREFGALYGTCCVCGRTLTNEVSIKNGIGPVCEGRGRWA